MIIYSNRIHEAKTQSDPRPSLQQPRPPTISFGLENFVDVFYNDALVAYASGKSDSVEILQDLDGKVSANRGPIAIFGRSELLVLGFVCQGDNIEPQFADCRH